MEGFRSEVLKSLTLEPDVTLTNIILIQNNLKALKNVLQSSSEEFFDDLLEFFSKNLTLREGDKMVHWKDYIHMPPLPSNLVPQYPENLLDSSKKLDFVYDPRREHATLSLLSIAADGLFKHAEFLRDLVESTSVEEKHQNLRGNEAASSLILEISKSCAAVANCYESFIAKICSPDLSIPDRDLLFYRVRICSYVHFLIPGG
jgi:hypothetical protein